MKTILHLKIALFICMLLPLGTSSQFTDYERDTKWNLGFNMGGVWQDGDILLDRPGFGYGFTLGKGIYEAPNKFWSLDLRLRYLKGKTFGQDIKLTDSSELADNSVFATNPTDYKNTLGFTYFNTETALHDFSLEAVINFHALREKTGVLLSVFGGIGITDYRTKTDLRNDKNFDKIYNYLAIDSANATKQDLRNLQDGSYESFAPFSENKTVKFMPSLGIGLGYQITPQWSIGFEHRVTFTLQDKFDGVERAGTQFLQWGDNDKYHYSSFFLRLNIFRGDNSSTSSNKQCPPPYVKIADVPNKYKVNTPEFDIKARVSKIKSNNDVIFVHNEQVVQTSYNSNTDYVSGKVILQQGENKLTFIASNACGETEDEVIVIYNPDFCPKAVITFTSPTKNTVSSKELKVTAKVSRLQKGTLELKLNNRVIAHQYSSIKNQLTADVILSQGNNTISIRGINKCGDTTVIKQIVYKCIPPTVTVSKPVNGAIYKNPTLTLNGVTKNVDKQEQVSVKLNGQSVPFSFTQSSQKITSNLNLRVGLNNVIVNVSNDCGNDSKVISFTYEEPCLLPVVSISAPANGVNVTNPSITVSGSVTKITSSNSVSMTVNGVAFNPNFNVTNGSFSSNVNLRLGRNTIDITGVNKCGQDKKTIVVNYNCPKPTVSISSPTNGSSVNSSSVVVRGIVGNVASKNEISLTVNGVAIPFSYNSSNRTFSGNAILRTGQNSITASVNNSCGSDSRIVSVSYSAPCPKPAVTINSPANGSSVSASSVVLSGTAINISLQSQMQVTLNGVSQSFSWNSSNKMFTASLNLRQGSNSIVVSANTNCGTDYKSITVNHNVACPAPAISIASPSNGSSVTNQTVLVTGTFANLSLKSEMQVKLNGVNQAFTFSTTTRTFSANLNLVQGNNSIVVEGANNCGNDSKTVNVVYSKSCPVPTVAISSPRNGTNATSLSVPFTGVVRNIQNASNVTLKLNGVSIAKNFNATTGIVTATLNIKSGGNTVELIATNNCGSDRKTTSVSYKCPLPTANIASPNNGMRYSTSPINFSGFVSGISAKSQVTITLNGTAIPFNYDVKLSKFSGSMNLVNGNNNLVATVTNKCGTSSKTVNVTYTKPCPKPVITILNPKNGAKPVDQAIAINGTVLNITNKSQMTLTLNGVSIPFTYNATSKTFTSNYDLTEGTNTIVATATTACGTNSSTVTVGYTRPCPKPIVTITTPKNGAAYPGPNAQVIGTTVNVTSKSQVQVKLNGVNVPFSYNTATKAFSASLVLVNGNNVVVVTATTACGTDSKTVTVSYAKPCPKPIVTLTSPKNGTTYPGPNTQIAGTTVNVSSKSQIQVKLNGVNVPFNFNTSTKAFSASITLRDGSNVVVVTVITSCGTDSKTVSVSYTAPCPKPAVSISSPRNGTSINGTAVTVTGTFSNIQNKSEMQVRLNGVNQNFTFNTSTRMYTAVLKLRNGSNTIQVDAATNCGNSSQSITVVSKQLVKPIINVFTPNLDTSVVNSNQVTLTGEVLKITGQSKFTVTINGKPFTKFAFNKAGTERFMFDGTMALSTGVNIIVFRAVHASGGIEVKTKVITVKNQIKTTNPKGGTLSPDKNVEAPSGGSRTPRKR